MSHDLCIGLAQTGDRHNCRWQLLLGSALTLSSIFVLDLPATPQDTPGQVPLATLSARRLQTCALRTIIGSAEREADEQLLLRLRVSMFQPAKISILLYLVPLSSWLEPGFTTFERDLHDTWYSN